MKTRFYNKLPCAGRFLFFWLYCADSLRTLTTIQHRILVKRTWRVELFLLLLLSCQNVSIGLAQDEIGHRAKAVLDSTYAMRFAAAYELADSLIADYPDHPAGSFFKSIVCFYELVSTHFSDSLRQEFMASNQRVIDLTEQCESDEETLIDCLFYRGNAFGNLGRYYGAQAKWSDAFFNARKSKNAHEEILRRNPDYYDAYFAVGLYNYYADTIPGFLGFLASLLGLGGDKEKGMRYVRLAYENGSLTRYEASFFLARLYSEQGKYEDARDIYRELQKSFPNNPYLLIEEGVNLYQLYEVAEATTVFEAALSKCSPETQPALAMTFYYLGRIDKLYNRYASSQLQFEKAVDYTNGRRLLPMVDGWLAASALYHKAESLEGLGQFTEARAAYRAAKEHPQASKYLRKAAQERLKHPRSALEVEYSKHRNLVLTGNYKKGRDSLNAFRDQHRAALKDRDLVGVVDYYLGRAYLALGQTGEALPLLLSAARFDDDKHEWLGPHAQFYSGECYLKLAEREKAREAFEKVLDEDKFRRAARMHTLAKERLGTL